MTGERLYLVTYDVATPKRLRRVHKLLKRYGDRVQLSVFLCRLKPTRRRRLETALIGLLDTTADRVLIADLGPAKVVGAGLCFLGLPQNVPSVDLLII